jgi:hypothetical protein
MQVENARIVPRASSAAMTGMTPTISFGLIDGHPVFMDERDDSYFLLEHEFETEFLKQLANDNEASSATPELREALGIDGDPGSVVFANCELPQRSLTAESHAGYRARIGDALYLAGVLSRTRRILARRPIEIVLAELVQVDADRVEQHEQDWHERLTHRARRFLAARPLLPFKPNCLLDSLALLSWLGWTRRGAMLVFGVKLEPFAAHCWIQTGSLILNDSVDNVERFGPVRVLKCSAVTR